MFTAKYVLWRYRFALLRIVLPLIYRYFWPHFAPDPGCVRAQSEVLHLFGTRVCPERDFCAAAVAAAKRSARGKIVAVSKVWKMPKRNSSIKNLSLKIYYCGMDVFFFFPLSLSLLCIFISMLSFLWCFCTIQFCR